MTDLFEITEPAQVEALAPFYCFSTQYAEERLRWKPRHPLLVMAVRAYRLKRADRGPERPGVRRLQVVADPGPTTSIPPT